VTIPSEESIEAAAAPDKNLSNGGRTCELPTWALIGGITAGVALALALSVDAGPAMAGNAYRCSTARRTASRPAAASLVNLASASATSWASSSSLSPSRTHREYSPARKWCSQVASSTPPAGSRLSNNLTAFRGGFRLWHVGDVPTLSGEESAPVVSPPKVDWRVI
jgi:hypothetical protein